MKVPTSRGQGKLSLAGVNGRMLILLIKEFSHSPAPFILRCKHS